MTTVREKIEAIRGEFCVKSPHSYAIRKLMAVRQGSQKVLKMNDRTLATESKFRHKITKTKQNRPPRARKALGFLFRTALLLTVPVNLRETRERLH